MNFTDLSSIIVLQITDVSSGGLTLIMLVIIRHTILLKLFSLILCVYLISSIYLTLLWVSREKSRHYIGGICIQRSCSCTHTHVNHTGSAKRMTRYVKIFSSLHYLLSYRFICHVIHLKAPFLTKNYSEMNHMIGKRFSP